MKKKMLMEVVMLMEVMMMSMVSCSRNTNSNTNWLDDMVVGRCPLSPFSSPPLQMDGAVFEQVRSSTFMNNGYYAALLFYDSASPFSNHLIYKFNLMSSMFPQIHHIQIEQSLVMPSLFSRYGIHSLPALLIVNKTDKWRYYGPKHILSLIHFYNNITGFEPVYYHVFDESSLEENVNSGSAIQPWYQQSWKDMVVKEPYLVFAILFVVVRAFLFVYPEMASHVIALWMLCKHHIKLEVLGESRQLLESAVHAIDLNKVWRKLKRCKSTNLERGARNAHVWASSLASVSLGDRPSSS